MTSKAHQQIQLILRHEVRECSNVLNERLQTIYSEHSAAGRLQSGTTVKVAVRAMDELATKAVDSLAEKVLQIVRDPGAYEYFQIAISDLLEFFRDELPTIVRMASGTMSSPPAPSIEQAAYELFAQLESKLETKVEILAYSFDGRSAGGATDPAIPSSKSLKSGRPPASFWDDMWATIACELYAGTLNPKTQADVERAMVDWIETHGFNAAPSTVRARARRLWDQLQAIA
jgi:hypothetical protein